MERKRNHQTKDDDIGFNFRTGSKEHFKRFLRHQMEASDDESEKNTTFIDPGEATPDGEHSTDLKVY